MTISYSLWNLYRSLVAGLLDGIARSGLSHVPLLIIPKPTTEAGAE